MAKPDVVIALAGNPNSGKTTLFNALTGARQHVGNYPGVTVERKEGVCHHKGRTIRVIDLPGTYSLSASSPEERIARNLLVNETPDVIVDVVDATNFERNLYLAVQMLELKLPLVYALNFADAAEGKGLKFDLPGLAAGLGGAVAPTVARTGKGLDALLDAVLARADADEAPARPAFQYGRELEEERDALAGRVRTLAPEHGHGQHGGERSGHGGLRKLEPSWIAMKLLEGDRDLGKHYPSLAPEVAAAEERLRKLFGASPEVSFAEARYGYISGLAQNTVTRTVERRHEISDTLDEVLLSRVWGLPIFLVLMAVVFHLVFTLAEPPMEWIEGGFGALGEWVAGFWPKAADSPVRDLLVDGVIGGVGGVLVFLPNIILLFLAIAFLEDTGYMARAAFVMDRLMQKVGLQGKSFIPMLLGFGCTVPAIMGTRTIENRAHRFVTILVLPLMSCGARLPIYALLIPAFFPSAWRAWILWGVYCFGVALAIVGAKLLRKTLFRGEAAPFVMELPPYRMPTVRSVLIHMWDRAREYCRKAGTIILAVSIVLWAMTAYPKKQTTDLDYDAERAAADESALASARDVGRALGLAADGEPLERWTAAGLAFEAAEGEFWEHETGFGEARAARDAAVARAESEGGETFAAFTKMLDDIDVVETAFADATEGLEKEDTGRAAADADRVFRLKALEDGAPELFALAVRYREEVLDARAEARTELDDREHAERLSYSYTGRIGHALVPVLRPLGFDWTIGTALVGAFAAKEVFVAQMGIVHSVGEADEDSDSLRAVLQAKYSPLQALCIILFCLVSAPCVATIAVAKREMNSWGWALGLLAGLTAAAWVLTFILWQAGSALGY